VTRPRVAGGIAAAALLLAGVGGALAVANAAGWRDLWTHFGFGEFVAAVTFAVVGGAVTVRAPAHRVGWLLLAVGVLTAVDLATWQYVTYAGPGRPTEALAWFSSWIWILSVLPFAVILKHQLGLDTCLPTCLPSCQSVVLRFMRYTLASDDA
jgi:hypothetical protein